MIYKLAVRIDTVVPALMKPLEDLNGFTKAVFRACCCCRERDCSVETLWVSQGLAEN
jgi:hypothetical protein